MANKDFGVKKIELIGSSGTPNLTSPTNLNLNASTVAISTDVTIGGKVQSNVIVGTGYSVGIGSTLPRQALDVGGTIRATGFVKSDGSAIGAGDTANIVTGIITATTYYGDGSNLSGISNVSIGDTAPSPATDNTLWWSSALAKGFIRYNDGNSSQWVEFSPSGGGGSGNIVGLSTAGNSYFTNIDVNNQSSLTNLNVSGFSTLTNLNVTGVSTFGSNLEIYVDGSDSVIREGGAGNLEIKANGIQLQEYDGTVFADFNGGPSGWQRFYHDGSNLKLEVNANGIDVTGHTETDTLNASGVSTFSSGSNSVVQIGLSTSLIVPTGIIQVGRTIEGTTLLKGGQINLTGPNSSDLNSTYYSNIRLNRIGGNFRYDLEFHSNGYSSGDIGDFIFYRRRTSYGRTERMRLSGETGNLTVTGSGSFNGLNVTGHTETDTLNVSGVSTTSSLNVGTAYSVSSGLGTFTASAGVSTNVASFNASDYKVVEYKLWIQHANGIQSQKVIIMHDDNDVYTQESDIFYSNTLLIGAGATISGGTVSLALTPESGVNGITTYRYSRESLV